MPLSVTPRSEWRGSAPPLGHAIGPVSLVILHHAWKPHVEATVLSGTERLHMIGMDGYHKRDPNIGEGIAYQWCVFQSGRVYEGRGWRRTGAHTEGQNSKSVGICFVIDGQTHAPSEAAIAATRALIAEGIRLLHIDPAYRLAAHGDFTAKDCPGARVREIFPLLRATDDAPVLREGSRGDDVLRAQRLLDLPMHNQTGFFGPITAARLREFQRTHGLTDDAVLGALSWAALHAEASQ